MRVAAFSTKKYERELLNAAKLAYGHDLVYFDSLLEPETASLAAGFAAVCAFVNDRADTPTIDVLARGGTRLIATRSTGFNHVDLKAAAEHGIASPVPLIRACPGRFARQPRRASVSYLARCMIVVEHYDSAGRVTSSSR